MQLNSPVSYWTCSASRLNHSSPSTAQLCMINCTTVHDFQRFDITAKRASSSQADVPSHPQAPTPFSIVFQAHLHQSFVLPHPPRGYQHPGSMQTIVLTDVANHSGLCG